MSSHHCDADDCEVCLSLQMYATAERASSAAEGIAKIAKEWMGVTDPLLALLTDDICLLLALAHKYRRVWDCADGEPDAQAAADAAVDLFTTFTHTEKQGLKGAFYGKRLMALLVQSGEVAVASTKCIRSRGVPGMKPSVARADRALFRRCFERLITHAERAADTTAFTTFSDAVTAVVSSKTALKAALVALRTKLKLATKEVDDAPGEAGDDTEVPVEADEPALGAGLGVGSDE